MFSTFRCLSNCERSIWTWGRLCFADMLRICEYFSPGNLLLGNNLHVAVLKVHCMYVIKRILLKKLKNVNCSKCWPNALVLFAVRPGRVQSGAAGESRLHRQTCARSTLQGKEEDAPGWVSLWSLSQICINKSCLFSEYILDQLHKIVLFIVWQNWKKASAGWARNLSRASLDRWGSLSAACRSLLSHTGTRATPKRRFVS